MERDIVEKLRDSRMTVHGRAGMTSEAADEIERLRAVMDAQVLELMGVEIDLRRDSADAVSFRTLARVMETLNNEAKR